MQHIEYTVGGAIVKCTKNAVMWIRLQEKLVPHHAQFTNTLI